MARTAWLILAASLLLGGTMRAQASGTIYGQVVDRTGKPVAYGSVRVCPNTGVGLPCYPLSTLYSDVAMQHQVSNPYTTDQVGNYSLVVTAPGSYIVQITAGAGNIYSYLVTVASGGGTTPTGPQYSIAGFTGSGSGGSTALGSTSLATDSTGNNLYIPYGVLSVTGQAGQNNTFTGSNGTNFFAITSNFSVAPTNPFTANQNFFLATNAYNYGCDEGNPPEDDPAGDYACETRTHGSYAQTYNYRNGIYDDHLQYYYSQHGGDDFWSYMYALIKPACVSGASECAGIWKINGTEQYGFPTGVVSSTTGTGDEAPVLNITSVPNLAPQNDIAPMSPIIDTSKLQLAFTIAGTATTSYMGTKLYLLPISGATATPSNTCSLLTTIPNATPLGTRTASSFTCTVLQGTMTNGKAIIVSGGVPEGTLLSGISISGSTVSGTLVATNAHFPTDVIVLGGTHGFLSEDQDYAIATASRSAYWIFGAADSTHLLTGIPFQGRMAPGPPQVGYEMASVGGTAKVYAGAMVESVGANLALTRLQINDVPWAVGDTIENPPNMANGWHMFDFLDSQAVPIYPGQQAGMFKLSTGGMGISSQYAWFNVINNNGCPLYQNCATTGGIWAPQIINAQGIFSSDFVLQQPIGISGSVETCSTTIVCVSYSNTAKTYYLFNISDLAGLSIQVDPSVPKFLFNGPIDFNRPLNVSDTFYGGWLYGGAAPNGQYWRCNGTRCIPSAIQAADLPAVLTPSSIATTGTTPGAVSLTAGTGSIPALNTSSAGFAAPNAGGTSYLLKLPPTITAGFLTTAAPASGDGVNESVVTVSTFGSGLSFSGGVLSATAAASLKGTVTFGTGTTDAATIPGVTTASVCAFSPTNSTAANVTNVQAFISSYATNTVNFTHLATTASGATESITCVP